MRAVLLVAIVVGIGCRIPNYKETYAGDVELTIRNRATVPAKIYLRPDAEQDQGREWGTIAPDQDAKYLVKAGRYEAYIQGGRFQGRLPIDVQKKKLVLISDDVTMRVPRGMDVVLLLDINRPRATTAPSSGGGDSCKPNGSQTDDFNGGDCCSKTVREVSQGDHVQPAYYCCEFGAAGCGTNR